MYTYAYLFSIFRRKYGGVRRCVAHVFVYTINDALSCHHMLVAILLIVLRCVSSYAGIPVHLSTIPTPNACNVVVSFILLPHRQCLLRDEYIISWYCSWFTNFNQVLFGLMYSSWLICSNYNMISKEKISVTFRIAKTDLE